MTAIANRDLVLLAQKIGADVVAGAADAVDHEARFPVEAFAALRQERFLGAMVPVEFGGGGASLSDIAAICQALGRHCASTGMIYAMHQIQVACLIRHAQNSPALRDFLVSLTANELLMGSATTELGVGGDVRTSLCAVDRTGDRFRLTKQAPVISYGIESDALMVTARRAPDAASNDQVIVLVRKADYRLTPTGTWDALGMRGTCSLGFLLEAEGSVDQIVPQPYGEISSHTMLPTSHLLWASLWLGIASDAVSRARAFVRAEARRRPGTVPPAATRLAEVVAELHAMRATVQNGLAEYERVMHDGDELSSLGFALRMNNIKILASRAVAAIVTASLGVVGIAGYRADSKFSLGRHLRDAQGASLMIANDRILAANAAMLLVQKDD